MLFSLFVRNADFPAGLRFLLKKEVFKNAVRFISSHRVSDSWFISEALEDAKFSLVLLYGNGLCRCL
jgi:hypothetical protein